MYAVAEGTGPELRDIAAARGADVRFGMFDLSVPGQAAAMVAAALAACGRTHGRPEAIAVLATTTDGFIHGHDLVVDGGYIIH